MCCTGARGSALCTEIAGQGNQCTSPLSPWWRSELEPESIQNQGLSSSILQSRRPRLGKGHPVMKLFSGRWPVPGQEDRETGVEGRGGEDCRVKTQAARQPGKTSSIWKHGVGDISTRCPRRSGARWGRDAPTRPSCPLAGHRALLCPSSPTFPNSLGRRRCARALPTHRTRRFREAGTVPRVTQLSNGGARLSPGRFCPKAMFSTL